uniref:C-type lectin domain-containing protein n=1 Tax=Plectus sambesii TaxID=2011161 RepID=A0A914UPP9_9BILA
MPLWTPDDNANSSACLMGWTKLAMPEEANFEYCVRIFSNLHMTFVQAEETCSHYSGAHLLSIQNEQELKIFESIMNAELNKSDLLLTSPISRRQQRRQISYWTGLGQLCPNSDSSKKPDLRWTDKSKYSETQEFWKNRTIQTATGFTNNWEKNYCVTYTIERTMGTLLRLGQSGSDKTNITYFNFNPCEERFPFVCKSRALRQVLGSESDVVLEQDEIADDDNEVEVASAERPCGRDPFWCPLKQTDSTGEKITCYRLLTQRDYWDNADAKCRAGYNGNLASIHSAQEMHFISNMSTMQPFVSGETKMWIGLHRRNSDRTYQWTDRTPFNFVSSVTVEASDETENDQGSCVILKVVGRANRAQLRLSERFRTSWRRTISLTDQKDKEENYWMHQRCDNKLPAVCQKPGFGNEPTPVRRADPLDLTKKCPQDWQQYLGKCYRLFGADAAESQKNFMDAKSACAQGSHLVSITGPYEQAFVLSLLRGKRTDAWLGLNIKNGQIQWYDDVPLSFTRFSPTNRIIHVGSDKYLFQNSNSFGFSQDACAYIEGADDASTGYWDLLFKSFELTSQVSRMPPLLHDTCGNKKLAYICEKYPNEPADTSSDTRRTFETICDEYDNSEENATSFCFIRKNNSEDGVSTASESLTQGTWAQADSFCHSFGNEVKKNFDKQFASSNLSSVINLFEWSFLTAKAKHYGFQELWLGLRYDESTGIFVWSDGWPVKIGPWAPGEPNLKRGICGAVRIDDDGPVWIMKDCNSVLPFICKLSNAKLPPPAELPVAICPEDKLDWIPGATRCYLVITNQSQITTGYRADHDCFKQHRTASLASFPTEADFKMFSTHIHTKKATIPFAYIGLIQQRGGSFAWTDRSEVTFLNWAPGHPEYGQNSDAQECVQMDLKSDYKWYDVSCWQSRHFVCSVPSRTAADLTTTEATTVRPSDPLAATTNGQIAIETTQVGATTTQPGIINADSSGTTAASSDGAETAKAIDADGTGFVAVGIVLTIVFILALASGIIYFVRQRAGLGGLWSSREPRIMQFDSLQNDDEFS